MPSPLLGLYVTRTCALSSAKPYVLTVSASTASAIVAAGVRASIHAYSVRTSCAVLPNATRWLAPARPRSENVVTLPRSAPAA